MALANSGGQKGSARRVRRSRLSAVNLWCLSAALYRRGLVRQAHWVKKLNTALYHNSLPPEVSFSPDIRFGHRYADILDTSDDGRLRIDYGRFHDTVEA